MFKKLVLLVGLSLFFCSCERAVVDSKSGKVVISIPQTNSIAKVVSEITTFAQGAPPATWSDVDCVGFMVSGPEAALNQNTCKLLNGNSGAYMSDFKFGPLHAGYYNGEMAEFDVPAGVDRVITAVGFKTNLTAANGAEGACKKILTEEKDSFSSAFVFATSPKFNVQSGTTQTVNLPINYVANSTPFFGDCSGPTTPGNGSGSTPSGPPVKMRMRFQNNLTSLTADSCVAVIFELLDTNGNKPTISENFSFNVMESMSKAEFFMIDGTYCTVAAGATTQTIPFFNGQNKISSIVLFMKTVANGNFNFIVTQSNVTNLPVEVPVNFPVYDHGVPSSEGPFKISIFDIHSFKSTSESMVSSPIKVKANECRPAVVQILDNAGRPVKVRNSSSINSYDSLLSVDSTFGVGVTNSSACAAPSATHPFSVTVLTQEYFLNRFYYKAPSGNTGQYFSMKTQNTGIGYYHPSLALDQLNPTAVVNNNSFWKVE